MWLVIESLKRLSNAYCPKGAIPCFRYVDLALPQLPALHWNGCFPGQTPIAAKGKRPILNITHPLSLFLSLSLLRMRACGCLCAKFVFIWNWKSVEMYWHFGLYHFIAHIFIQMDYLKSQCISFSGSMYSRLLAAIRMTLTTATQCSGPL